MSIQIKLNFLDGELVDDRIADDPANDLVLQCNESFDIEFIFCNADGTPLGLPFTGSSAKVQLLLSKLDYLLASAEEKSQWGTDAEGFPLLALKNVVLELPEFDWSESDCHLENAADHCCWIDCELSAAFYVTEMPNLNMQFFFTINCIIKL